MAEQRVYEVLFIVDPATGDEDLTRLTDNLSNIITEQGGNVTRNETLGRRHLAYRVNNKNEGVYVLFEVEGTGREIAELERRMRVSDQVMRYLTVRVDEDRQRAEKLKARRVRKAQKRGGAGAAAGADGAGA
ncbi:MAG TPA: 30S ribosomal protein S6 [Pyrinomonadaceae bacterium]|nr:30S ribosomal protein S6 [Pyrinomonadaceae bacterium]